MRLVPWRPKRARQHPSVLPRVSPSDAEEEEEKERGGEFDEEVGSAERRRDGALAVSAGTDVRAEDGEGTHHHTNESDIRVIGNGPNPEEEAPEIIWRRRRIVAVYFVTVTLLFADMNLMAPNLTEIGKEFGFTEDERDVKLGGLIALTFFFVGAPVSFLIGWLADSVRRSPLYAATVLFGEAACFATYFVRTFPQLFACRTMTGISVGGAIPVIYSVLGDLYPANQRAAISALVFTGTGLGAGIGQALAGFLGEKHGWRLPFLVVSVPGIFCAGFLFCIKDPERGGKEAAKLQMDEKKRMQQEEARQNQEGQNEEPFEDEDALLSCVSCEVSAVGNADGAPKLQDGSKRDIYLRDEDATISDRGDVECKSIIPAKNKYEDSEDVGDESPLSSSSTERRNNAETTQMEEYREGEMDGKASWKTTWQTLKTPSVALTIIQAAPGAVPFGFCSTFLNDYLQENRGMTKAEATGVLMTWGVGNALGVISGGVLGHQTYKRDVRGPPIVMGTSLILSCIPLYFLTNLVDNNTSVARAAIISIFAGMFAVIPVPLERAILANVTVPESRGRANSMLSIVDDLGKGLGPAIVSILIRATDRQTAFNFSLLGWVAAGVLSFVIVCFVEADEQLIQEKVRDALEKQEEITRGASQSLRKAETAMSTKEE